MYRWRRSCWLLSRRYYNSSSVYRSFSSNSKAQMLAANSSVSTASTSLPEFPGFADFLRSANTIGPTTVASSSTESIPYIDETTISNSKGKVLFETYGCQMNVNDTEIARSVLFSSGYTETKDISEADVVLLMTCAIREGAEEKVWSRVKQLQLRRRIRSKRKKSMKIGILGCMAERLKTKILEREPLVDLIAGPDSYRDLPRMLAITEPGQAAVNILLSMDETYADISPVRVNNDAVSAYVSIMRGCENMCAFCIVPFTRGKERSRPIDSILDEVRKLSDEGVKEITLLGQNVNSYRDMSDSVHFGLPDKFAIEYRAPGFNTVYRPRTAGRPFVELLDKVSQINPEIRIRFTSPHPKDFPDEVLQLIADRANICKLIHLPAQSGNNETLERMRRGYTREAYLELVARMRSVIPNVALTSDFMSGFCGETEAAHKDTVSLIDQVHYQFCFCYPYSMREKTKAHRTLVDDVAQEVKNQRTNELLSTFRRGSLELNRAKIGTVQLVLVQGPSKRSPDSMAGRNDQFVKVIVPKAEIPNKLSLESGEETRNFGVGDYVAVQIVDATSQTMKAVPLYITSLSRFEAGISQPLHLKNRLLQKRFEFTAAN